MAFDGLAIACIRHELENTLTGGRLDKILQPERDEICLAVRCGGKNLKLTVSASSSNPRVHLTSVQKENPEKAPMFCMLLRKHLSNGKIAGFKQPGFERVLEIHIESRNELGDISVKRLIAEIMGRHSNIILVDDQNRVLGSIKHVDFSVSSLRQVIPGMQYELPPHQGKLDPLSVTKQQLYSLIEQYHGKTGDFMIETFTGIGPLSSREIAFRAAEDWDVTAGDIDKKSFGDKIYDFICAINKGSFFPVLLYKKNKRIWDFSSIEITHYGDGIVSEKKDSLNEAVDQFYGILDFQDRMQQKTAGLAKFIDNNIKRCQKKLALQQQKLKDSLSKEQDKQFGDLLTANLYRISDNDAEIQVENYYDDMRPVTIKLKPGLSPSQNAQRYYTLYQKAKNAEIMAAKQIKLTEKELDYLESVQDSLSRAESVKDINEIRSELLSQGYGVKQGKLSKSRKEAAYSPMSFALSDGFELRIGRNNIQNDELTLKLSKSADTWLHTKNIHGSHGVISTFGKTPSDDVIVEAAKLCAYYSKARGSANVPVDYTAVKNVKKPSGARPGMVIYDNYSTVNVKPCSYEELFAGD